MAYGKYKYSNIKGEKGSDWNIEIWKKDFNVVPSVGDDFQGGVVFKVTATDVYVVAKENIIDGATTAFDWGCVGTSISGADGTAIGTGKQNTADIIAGCSSTDSAAYMCSNLNSNGYLDWYLPSKDELVEIYNNKSTLEAVSGFSAFGGNNFWSSSESSNLNANLVFFFNGTITQTNKGVNYNVRPIRSYNYTQVTEFDTEGEGFEITWNGRGGTRNKDFIGSACTLNMIIKDSSEESFVYDVLTSGVKNYYIRIYKGAVDASHTNLWWFGWIQPGFDLVENSPFPYSYNLTATDSYGYLNQLKPVSFDYEWEKQGAIADVSTETVLILDLGGSIDVGGSSSNNLTPAPDSYYWHRTSADWWASGDYDATENCLTQYYVSRGAYANRSEFDDEGNLTTSNNPLEYKLQDVFNGTLRLFNLVGFLAEGKYNFIQPNSLVGNTSGSLSCFNRKALIGTMTSETVNTLLTIDQSNNVILAGSGLTYEPSLTSVSIKYPQEASFNVPADTDLEGNTITAGYVGANSGLYSLNYVTKNFTTVVKSNFSFNDNDHDIYNNTFQTTSNLTFKLSNGTDNYYLQPQGDGVFSWTLNNSTALPISIVRGFLAGAYPQPQNTLEFVLSGGISNDPDFTFATGTSNNLFNGGGGGGNFPCRRRTDQQVGSPTVTYSRFETLLKFECSVQSPPISGLITLTTSTSNNYYQRQLTGVVHAIDPINDPAPYTNETKILELQLTPFESDSVVSGNTEVVYSASQDTTTSLEYEELGSSAIGQTSVNDLYAVKRKVSPLYPPVTGGFRRGDSGDFRDILQLNVNEYLDLQTEPLEVLQADIQSANISPLKLVKYSINDNGSYKYYQFLGGTFKAQSEIMSGEWYKVESSTSNPIIIDDPTSNPTELILNPIYNNLSNIGSSISGLNNLNTTGLRPMILGTLDAALASGAAITNISFDSNVEGKYYTGQKLYLALANGSAQQEITCSTTKTGVAYVDVSSITPSRDYPIGSIVLVKTSDLTNVIVPNTPTPNLYQGITTQYIFLKPNDFLTTSGTTFKMYTRDAGASVQPSAFVSRTKVYAMFWTPAGYEVTDVDVYGANNRTFILKEGVHNSSSSVNVQTGGTMNTTMTLTTAKEFVVGKYGMIEVEFGASNDTIYGAKITIQAI
tara:strand:+ start:11903 stop:15349 length:3447 start_codon:yes stop_codon:yes gene_type:complete